jgi:hypothetical protein
MSPARKQQVTEQFHARRAYLVAAALSLIGTPTVFVPAVHAVFETLARIDAVEGKLTSLGVRFDAVDSRFERLEDDLADRRSLRDRQDDIQNQRITALEQRAR